MSSDEHTQQLNLIMEWRKEGAKARFILVDMLGSMNLLMNRRFQHCQGVVGLFEGLFEGLFRSSRHSEGVRCTLEIDVNPTL